MGKFVEPKVFFVGATVLDHAGMADYLRESGNEDFAAAILQAKEQGLSDGEILCSFYGKLCYSSLTVGHNKNIKKVRDVHDNFLGLLASAHGSVLEHVQLNFVVRNCSRVFTHELVRHRVGTAFSQTSGRYVRGDEVDVVFDPILEPVRAMLEEGIEYIEDLYRMMCTAMGLNGREALRHMASIPRANPWAGMIEPTDEDLDRHAREKLGIADLDNPDMACKKMITSALRRFLPNGQSNEMGFSLNLRALRHLVMLRTSRHSEWEIRHVFGQIYHLVKERYPLIFSDAEESTVNGLLEVTGLKTQPYEQTG